MFDELVIAEYGDIFTKSIDIGTSVSSTNHQGVTDIRPKEEIYALLGINTNTGISIGTSISAKVELPHITILTKSVFPIYEVTRDSSHYCGYLVSEIHKHNVNILLFDQRQYSGGGVVDYYVDHADCSTVKYSITTTTSSSKSFNMCSRGNSSLPKVDNISLSNIRDDNSIIKLYEEVLISKVKKLIVDTIKYHQLKEQKYLIDNDLLPRHTVLQSKVMEFFGIEDQSAIINDLRDQLAKAQQQIAERDATIENLTNDLTAVSSLIGKYTK